MDMQEALSLSEMDRSIGAFLKEKMDQNISSKISLGYYIIPEALRPCEITYITCIFKWALPYRLKKLKGCVFWQKLFRLSQLFNFTFEISVQVWTNIDTYVFRIGALTRTSPFYLWSFVLQFFRHINSNFQKRIAYHLNVTISSINNDV